MNEPPNPPSVSETTTQNSSAAPAGPDPLASATAAAKAPGPGRPASYAPEKLHAVCAFIRLTGMSDTAAGALAGVTRSVLSRWKQQDEEVELALEKARAQYRAPRLEAIGNMCRKDGQLDWRAQAWLVKFAAPPGEGAPSRRRSLHDVEVPLTDEEKQAAAAAAQIAEFQAGLAGWAKWKPSSHAEPTAEMLTVLQWRRRIAREEQEARAHAATGGSPPEIAAACASIPEPAEASVAAVAGPAPTNAAAPAEEAPNLPEAVAEGASESVTIPPEIAAAVEAPAPAEAPDSEPATAVPAVSDAPDPIAKSVTIPPEIQAAGGLNHGEVSGVKGAIPPANPAAPASEGMPPGHAAATARISRRQARAEQRRVAREAARAKRKGGGE